MQDDGSTWFGGSVTQVGKEPRMVLFQVGRIQFVFLHKVSDAQINPVQARVLLICFTRKNAAKKGD